MQNLKEAEQLESRNASGISSDSILSVTVKSAALTGREYFKMGVQVGTEAYESNPVMGPNP